MSRILCDASPLIFLAKLDQLALIEQVLGEQIFVLKCVVDELQSDKASLTEKKRLTDFFETVQIIDFQIEELQSSALSRSDQSSLRWAMEHCVDWLLVDERLLRRVAIAEGISVISFLGILLAAATRAIISPIEARDAVDEVISKHGCRISVAVYQRVVCELKKIGG